LQFANEAAKKGLKPHDLIEWMPFLQAYALNGKMDELASVMAAIQPDEYVTGQACEKLKSLPTNVDIENINSKYCSSPK
jgi:hypothetical protein